MRASNTCNAACAHDAWLGSRHDRDLQRLLCHARTAVATGPVRLWSSAVSCLLYGLPLRLGSCCELRRCQQTSGHHCTTGKRWMSKLLKHAHESHNQMGLCTIVVLQLRVGSRRQLSALATPQISRMLPHHLP